MEQCQRCKIDYPDGYTSRILGTLRPLIVCGICSLKIQNQITGFKRKSFDDPVAEDLRVNAVLYRKQKRKI